MSEEGAVNAIVQHGAGIAESTLPAEVMTRTEQLDSSPTDPTSAEADVEVQVLTQRDGPDHRSDSITSMHAPDRPPQEPVAEGSREMSARGDDVSADMGDFNLTGDELIDHIALWEIFTDLRQDREGRAAVLLGRSA